MEDRTADFDGTVYSTAITVFSSHDQVYCVNELAQAGTKRCVSQQN